MAEGLHYPIYIQTPSEMDITLEQFNKLSCIGLASLLISWKYVIENKEDVYRIYGSETPIWELRQYPRFKDLDAYEWPSVEMLCIDVPKDIALAKTIEKYFSHLILK